MWMGVDLFFVLSGFLITGVLLDAKQEPLASFFSRFYSRRARRILVPYVLMLAFGSLVYGVAWTQHWYLYVFLTNLLTPLHIEHPQAFDPLWSLAVEEQFYLVWPFAVYFLDSRSLRRLCVVLMLAAPALRGLFHFNQLWPIYMLTLFRMDLLAAGGLLCLEWRMRGENIQRYGTGVGLGLVSLGVAGVLILMKLGYSTNGNTRVGNVLVYEACLIIVLGVMIFALADRWVEWLRWGPVTYLGRISYSMYLVHLGVIFIVNERFHGLPAAAIALALTVTYAAVSWSLVESRLIKKNEMKAVS